MKHFFKTYFSENQINISEQKVPLLKSYRKCYHNAGNLIWQTDEIINTFNIFFILKMLEAMLNGILLADYVDKIIGKSYFAQKSLRLTEINAQTSHFWSVVVLLLLKNSFVQDLFAHGIHGHKCPMANAV